MPELNLQVETVEVDSKAISPLMVFKLQIENADASESIQNIALHCQLQIESTRRRYSPEEQVRLKDLFGESDRWNQTLRAMLWTHANAFVPPFTGRAMADLPVACTFDFNVAATKYFAGLTDGEIPLNFLFSGTVFYRDESGDLQATQIPWDREARFRLPVQTWQRMMDLYYPNSAWLSLHRDTYDRLCQFKVRNGLPTWEHTFERLLDAGDRAENRCDNPLAASHAENSEPPRPIVLRKWSS